MEENRRLARLNEPIFILCYCKQAEIIKGFTGNISRNGLMFDTDMLMSTQDCFFLDIYMPIKESKKEISVVSVSARVKWIKPIDNDCQHSGSNKYKIGMEFLKNEIRDEKDIAAYVEGKLKALG